MIFWQGFRERGERQRESCFGESVDFGGAAAAGAQVLAGGNVGRKVLMGQQCGARGNGGAVKDGE